MRCLAKMAILCFIVTYPVLVGAETREFPEGSIFVPKKVAEGAPVLVIAEFPGRGTQLLGMLEKDLEKFGVVAFLPKIPMDGRQLDVSKAMTQVDGLAAALEKDFKHKAGNKYAFGFSAAGPLGADLGLRNADKFAGLILAATLGVNPNSLGACKNKKLPVFMTCGERDPMASPERMSAIRKTLVDGGMENVELKILPGTDHMQVVQQKAPAFLEWMTGTKSAASEVKVGGKFTLVWRRDVGSPIAAAAVAEKGGLVGYAQDNKVYAIDPKGNVAKTIDLAGTSAFKAGGGLRAGFSGKDLAVFALSTADNSASDPNVLVGLDIKKGKLAWKIDEKSGIYSAVGGDVKGRFFGYGSHDTNYHVTLAVGGKEKFAAKTGVSCASAGRFGADVVVFAGTDGVFAWSLKTGKEIWNVKQEVALGSDPIALDEKSGSVYVAVKSKLIALNVRDGASKWEKDLPSEVAAHAVPVAFPKGGCLIGCGETLVRFGATGEKTWEKNIGASLKVVAAGEKFCAVLTDPGELVAVDAGTGEPRAKAEESVTVFFPFGDNGWVYVSEKGEAVSVALK